jgi:signal transduction histidine kinase
MDSAIPENPYKQLAFYDIQDEDKFFGRDYEITKLIHLVKNNRTILLYGTSGTGKTSLLRAGVIPKLTRMKEQNFIPIYVRLTQNPIADVQRGIAHHIAQSTKKEAPKPTSEQYFNRSLRQAINDHYNFSELKVLCYDLDIGYESLAGDTMPEKVVELIAYCKRNGRIQHLVDFCQHDKPHFIWPTLLSKPAAEIEPLPPHQLTTDSPLIQYLMTAAQTLESELILILDQFEDILSKTTLPYRNTFLEQLSAVYHDLNLPVKIIIIIREEFLAQITHELEKYDLELVNGRLFLLPLTRDQAKDAIINPTSRIHIQYQEELVEKLLDDLISEEQASHIHNAAIMPPQLQLACNALFEYATKHSSLITLEDYENIGGVRGILGRYLDEILKQFLLAERQLIWKILSELVSSAGSSRIVTIDSLEHALQIEHSTLQPLLHRLIRIKLIRPLQSNGTTGYELVHGYLADKIKLSKDVREQKAIQELIAQELKNWRLLRTLISPDRLRIIQQYLEEKQLNLSQEENDLLERSKEQKKLNEKAQLHLIESDKMNFLEQIVAGIDKEISSPISAIKSNSDYLKDEIDDIIDIINNLPANLTKALEPIAPNSENAGTQNNFNSPITNKIQDFIKDHGLSERLTAISQIAIQSKNSTLKMVDLIRVLSNFAKTDNTKFKPINLIEIQEAAKMLLAHRVMKNNIRVFIHHNNETLYVNGIASQLIQLFIIILDSAITAIEQASQPPSKEKFIRIMSLQEDESCISIITHNGLKYASAHFDSGIYIIKGESNHEPKNGFSLAIAREIVHRHEGEMQIKESDSELSVLQIKLPIGQTIQVYQENELN